MVSHDSHVICSSFISGSLRAADEAAREADSRHGEGSLSQRSHHAEVSTFCTNIIYEHLLLWIMFVVLPCFDLGLTVPIQCAINV